MGNCCVLYRSGVSSRTGDLADRKQKVLQLMKTEKKVLDFRPSIVVNEIPVNFPAAEHPPPNCDFRAGKTRFMLPPLGPNQERHTRTIKIVITKQQLQELLANKISMKEVLRSRPCHARGSPMNWKPKLDSVPEEID